MIQEPGCFGELREDPDRFAEALRVALETPEYFRYIQLHARPDRLAAFMAIAGQLSDDEYWSLLGTVYGDTEDFWRHPEDWESLLTSTRPGRENFAEEIPADLPDVMTLYRGWSKCVGREGWAWTTHRPTAVWFANGRIHEQPGGAANPRILTGTALKSDAIGYFRLEREIVIPWGKVTVISDEEVSREEIDGRGVSIPDE